MALRVCEVQKVISPNEIILYTTRGSAISLAGDIGNALVFLSLFVSIALYSWPMAWILSIFPAWYIIYSSLSFASVIHVVTEFNEKDGGNYYRLSGVFSTRADPLPINRYSPDMYIEISFWIRVWKWITAQNLLTISVRSDAVTTLFKSDVPKRLYDIINELKGDPPKSLPKRVSNTLELSRSIRAAYHDGVLTKDMASALLLSLFREEIGV